MDFLTIGGATKDLFLYPEQTEQFMCRAQEMVSFPLGHKLRIDSVQECFGGGAANVAVGLAYFGFRGEVIASIGQDSWGEEVLKNLESFQVLITSVQQNSKEQTAFSLIFHGKQKDRVVLAFSGANRKLKFYAPKKIPGLVMLNHLSGESVKETGKIFNWLEKNPHIFVSWNPGKETLEKGVEFVKAFLQRTNALFLNKEEVELFTQKSFDTQKEEIFYIFSHLGIDYVFVTDGKNGANLFCKGKEFFQGITSSNPPVDTLGAGDAFATGALQAILKKKNPEEILFEASENAAKIVAHLGAQTAYKT